MPAPYSYTLLEKLFQYFADRWSLKADQIDNVAGRQVELRRVTATTPVTWATELRNLRIDTTPPGPVVDRASLAGIPVQRISVADRNNPKKWVSVHVHDPYHGEDFDVSIPKPKNGFWVEGYPNPLNDNGASGAWDAHLLLVCVETKEAWELIGFNAEVNWALDYGYYSAGVLKKGRPVCKGGKSMTAITLTPDDEPHRLGLVANDYIGGDGTKKVGSGYPTCGATYALSDAAYDRIIRENPNLNRAQLTVVNSLHHYGADLYDRGRKPSVPYLGIGLAQQYSKWNGTGVEKLQIKGSDIELVTATA